MTRSRSKREAERRRSNSKVLRNDKIVENCPNPGQNQRAAGTRNRVDSERTPSKKAKKERKLSAGEPTTKRSKSRVVESDSDGGKAAESSAAKELYEYKRSLKVPPELITIDGGLYMHRISTSLPDLDSPHHSDGSETFSEIVKKLSQRDKLDDNEKFSSIIELLHRRCLAAQAAKPTVSSSSGRGKGAKGAGKGANSNNTSSSESTKPKQEYELLPTPGAESESLFSKNSKKKKSLFDTAILKSRTRTEQKAMQSKEMIREVFGGDGERPQSAPPLSCDPEPPPLFEEGLQNVTYDEKYNELMRNVDRIVGELDGGAVAAATTPTPATLTVPPAPKKRGRGHRTSRRKGSSGFDYIRKKKKPSQQHSQGNHGNQQHGASGDETHISKEIRSWVLNKGVGESVMHKAARLGYTDVIVYCLERLDMDPDLKDNAGYTPLHEACAKGHLDIANYLLQYGASHSEPAPSGMRPLHEAVENSFVEIVRLLLAFGADPMLATYAGMTPIQLAESDDMTLFLEHHLKDVQSMAPNKTGWKFDGPWKIHDPEESGCNVFSDIPGFEEADSGLTTSLLNTSGTSSSGVLSSTSSKQCDSNSNIMHYEVGGSATTTTNNNNNSTTTDTDGGPARKRNGITAIAATTLPAGLRNGKIKRELPKQESEQCRLPNGGGVEPRPKLVNGQVRKDGEQPDLELHDAGSEDSEGGGEINFEYEESDRPLPPLYVLKDEYNERWMLMSDLCTFLKFKSKEAVLRQICPNNSPTNQRELIREMKIEEFLTRANCLQLLCAGEKLNIHASKVVLVKYNDSVKSLLQVQSYATRI
ncbi:AGAP007537-PB [Anopheles gambiae str. PEST]|uniref:AGAP007537-PB n=2 Tax=Anopheles gambiae TaxID=7165 RepID=Q7PT12_ANOGA|nr:AGAP007537-PB [Anopheles gambiae str. PEST]